MAEHRLAWPRGRAGPSAAREPLPCRTVTTKSDADEEVDLAGLDGVVLVDVPERLQHQEQAVVVALELGPLVGVERVLDGEGVQAERDRATVLELDLGSGSCRPTQTKSPSSVAPANAARGGRWGHSPGGPAPRGGRARCRRSRGRGYAGVRSRHGNRDPRCDTAAPPRTRPASSPGARGGPARRRRAAAGRARPRHGWPPSGWPRIVSSPLERCRADRAPSSRAAQSTPLRRGHRARAHRVRLRRVDRAGRSRSWPRRSSGAPCRPSPRRPRSPAASRWRRCGARGQRRGTPPGRRSRGRARRRARSGWRSATATRSRRSSPTRSACTSTRSSGSCVDPASISVVRYTAARPFVLSINTHEGDLSWLTPPPAHAGAAVRRDAAVGGGADRSAARPIGWPHGPLVHRFDPPERFVAGTVGPPGQRTFFLQAREGTRVRQRGAGEAAGRRSSPSASTSCSTS